MKNDKLGWPRRLMDAFANLIYWAIIIVIFLYSISVFIAFCCPIVRASFIDLFIDGLFLY
jgi:hypothetical protein